MSPRLPRRTRGEPVSPPEPGAQQLGGDQEGHSEPAEPESTELATGAEKHEHEPTDEPATASAPPVAPVVVPRWIQLVVLPLALLGLWALARAAGSVVIIVMVASVT